MTRWNIMYKCRLCGRTFSDGGTTSDDTAIESVMNICFDKPNTPGTPKPLDIHDCVDGEFAGSYGLADFIGFKKVEDDS